MNRITGLYLRIIRRKRQQHITRQAIAEAPTRKVSDILRNEEKGAVSLSPISYPVPTLTLIPPSTTLRILTWSPLRG